MSLKDLKIKFISPLKGFIEEPKPSLLHIPKAYKEMAIHAESISTVKRCIPFLDAFTSGYIIPFPVDTLYEYNVEKQQCSFKMNENIPPDLLSFIDVQEHALSQIKPELRSNKRTVEGIFKFKNPWGIKTPPGYSCLFLTPMNHVLPFELISGVVDTDSYNDPIHFPFYWIANPHDHKLMKAGTPMAMVVPFKRESWKMTCQVTDMPDTKEKLRILKYFNSYFDNYKKNSWKKKSYK